MFCTRMAGRIIGVALLCCAALARAGEPGSRVVLDKDGRVELYLDRHAETPCFVLRGLPRNELPSVERVFSISVVPEVSSADLAQQTPEILGRYERVGSEIRFFPRFPINPRVTFHVRLSPALRPLLPDAPDPILLRADDAKQGSTAEVVAVYPSAEEVPENLLKFYIHFSEAMSRGNAYRWIKLYDGDRLVTEPFLELGEELWDPEQRRFTLFLHPGRIKRGVRPNEELGPPLVAGHEYTLTIDRQWKDADGVPMRAGFTKRFRAVAADRELVDPQRWKLETASAGSRQPVAIVLDKPLDHAMLHRVLTVKHQSGRPIEGSVLVSENETRWEFKPDLPWKTGTYFIEVAANLEDLCGNTIARPFETKLEQNVAADPSTRIAIEFIVQ